jgi:hypothetical protein
LPIDPSLLEPYERLVPVTVEGRTCLVPANNSLLRALQYLDYDLYPCRLCWNGDCDNCRFDYAHPETGEAVNARGCETEVFAGMRITRLPENVVWPAALAAPACVETDD